MNPRRPVVRRARVSIKRRAEVGSRRKSSELGIPQESNPESLHNFWAEAGNALHKDQVATGFMISTIGLSSGERASRTLSIGLPEVSAMAITRKVCVKGPLKHFDDQKALAIGQALSGWS